MKKVAILCTHGLPANYGAFEQTVDRLVNYSLKKNLDIKFLVQTNSSLKSTEFKYPNVSRLIINRKNGGIGTLLYGISGAFFSYLKGYKTFLCFGYTLAPLFFIFELMGIKVICNVDGFEWRRGKWGYFAKTYLKFCEFCAGHSKAELIYDSNAISRYYSLFFSKRGTIAFYGTEPFNLPELHSQSDSVLNEYQLQSNNFFVVVMRMEPENNIFTIVQAFKDSLSSKSLILIRPKTDYFVDSVLPLIVNDKRIRYLGPIYERKKLMALRSVAFSYIHGHSVGGTNPTLVEAIYLQRPVIAFHSIFNKEVLKVGAFFSNVSSLTKIINEAETRFLQLPNRLSAEYTWDFVLNKYVKIIHNLED